MSNILFIVGLPGSGKSTLAEKINADNGSSYKIIDDPKNWESDIFPFLNQNLIIADPHLCFEKSRNSAIRKIKDFDESITIDWIFFENDPDACLRNAKSRMDQHPDKKVDSFIRNLHDKYTIPPGSTVVSVYK